MTAGHRGATGDPSALPPGLDSLPPSWTVLHDVAWPGRRPATVDHVLVGPPGVFVVRGSRARTAQHPRSTRSAVEAAAAVAAAVPFVPRHQVHAVVRVDGTTPVRVDRCPAEQPPVRDALVVGSADLVTTLMTRPAILPPDHALALGVALRAELEPAAVRPGRPLPTAAPAPRRTPAARRAPAPRRTPSAGGVAGAAGVRGVRVAGAGLAAAVLAAVLVAPQLALSPVRWAADGVSALATDDRVAADDAAAVPTVGVSPSPSAAASSDATASPDRVVDREELVAVPVDRATATPDDTGDDGVATTTAPVTGDDTPGTTVAPSAAPGTGPSATGGRGRGGAPAGGRDGGGDPVGVAPRAADFVALLASLMGPGGRVPGGTGLSGVLGSLTDLVRGGSLPGGLSLGGTPAGPGRCVHDAAAGVSLVLAVNGRDGHLALREGPCTEGRELARIVERGPADYRLRGDRSLARPVAALLRPGGRSS